MWSVNMIGEYGEIKGVALWLLDRLSSLQEESHAQEREGRPEKEHTCQSSLPDGWTHGDGKPVWHEPHQDSVSGKEIETDLLSFFFHAATKPKHEDAADAAKSRANYE
jgi:hypothetical protein